SGKRYKELKKNHLDLKFKNWTKKKEVFKRIGFAKKKSAQKVKRNSWGVFSLAFIVILSITALLAYVIAPDNTVNANNGDISISTQKPGFKVQTINIPLNNNTSSLSDLFTGKAVKEEFIPILSYKIQNDTLFYQEFS